jgi:peptide/nickel transport system permease protein
MRAYLLRRILLLVPTLFGISLVNFLIINLAPAPRSSSVGTSGEYDRSTSVEAKEGEFIFRQTFNLDKPTLLNFRFALGDGEILWLVSTPLRVWELPKDRRGNQNLLDDYGRAIVPHLVRVGEACAGRGGALESGRADYERRWAEARGNWMRKGRPPGVEEWPPPERPPPFDGAFRERLLRLTLDRLANNAPRRPRIVFGSEIDPETERENAEVRDERARLRAIYLDEGLSPDAKMARWKAWHDERAAEWEYGLGRKIRTALFDTRFARFWERLATGDLGSSFLHRRSVWDLILERLKVSVVLSFGALMLAYLMSVPLGILAAAKHRSLLERGVSISLFAAYSLPAMVLGLLLREYLSVGAHLFPVSGYESADHARRTFLGKLGDNAWHAVLPLATYALGLFAYYSRYMKAGMMDIVRTDFVRTARAKGVPELVVIVKHAARNGLIPIVTLLGTSLPALIGGSIVIEVIFGIDGMGHLGFEAVRQHDFAVLMGLNVVAAALTMVGVLLADLAYAVVDPRISYR